MMMALRRHCCGPDRIIILLVFVGCVTQAWAAQQHLDLNGPPPGRNASSALNRVEPAPMLKRHKRYLLWEGGGVSKSVLGLLVPVQTADRVNWRTLNMGYNFQAQYVPVPSIIYPWTRFERSLHERKQQHDADPAGFVADDGTRQFVYTAYETIVDRRGGNGRQCLLRAICEAAQSPVEHVGVFDELLQLFLTPSDNDVHADYVEARQAGRYGVDCLSLYHGCPIGSGLLDSISFFKG